MRVQKSNDVFSPNEPIIMHDLLLNIKNILLINVLVEDRNVFLQIFEQYESPIRFAYQENDQSNSFSSTKYVNIDRTSLGLIKILKILSQNDFSIISYTTISSSARPSLRKILTNLSIRLFVLELLA